MAKKRLPRLAYAIGTSATLELEDANWKEFEEDLDQHLDADQRASIVGAVAEYLREESLERAAPLVREEALWLEKVGGLAEELHKAVLTSPGSAARHGLAEVQAAMNLGRGDVPAFDLLTVATALCAAVETVRHRRDAEAEWNKRGFADGEAWAALVFRLKALLTEWGISTGVRNDDEGVSPFVSFLNHLQAHFPPESRRHHQSLPALAKAISRSAQHFPAPINRTQTAAEWLEEHRKLVARDI